MFYGNTKIKTLILPDSLTIVGDGAFYGCENLRRVVTGEGLVVVGEGAFGECPRLTRFDFPAAVNKIGAGACYDTPIARYTVDPGSAAFASDGDAVYTADLKTLVLYPAGSAAQSFTVPEGVETIGERAFAFAANLKSVALPESLLMIGKEGFLCCGLSEITLPEKLESLEAERLFRVPKP